MDLAEGCVHPVDNYRIWGASLGRGATSEAVYSPATTMTSRKSGGNRRLRMMWAGFGGGALRAALGAPLVCAIPGCGSSATPGSAAGPEADGGQPSTGGPGGVVIAGTGGAAGGVVADAR